MNCKYLIPLATMGVAAFLLGPSPALAAVAPSLGAAASFGVLGASTVTCTNFATITGTVGVSPGTAITGFPAMCTATALAVGAVQAQKDAHTAYLGLAAQACDFNYADTFQLGGKTLPSGVHCFPSDALLNGTLTLTGNGPWIFRMGSALTTGGSPAAPARVLVNGNASCNVFWQIGSSATIGVNTQFAGNILAVASITLVSGASVDGRALALNGAVTLDGNKVTTCSGSGGGCKVKVIFECDDDHHDCDNDHDDNDHDDNDHGGNDHDNDHNGNDHNGNDHHGH